MNHLATGISPWLRKYIGDHDVSMFCSGEFMSWMVSPNIFPFRPHEIPLTPSCFGMWIGMEATFRTLQQRETFLRQRHAALQIQEQSQHTSLYLYIIPSFPTPKQIIVVLLTPFVFWRGGGFPESAPIFTLGHGRSPMFSHAVGPICQQHIDWTWDESKIVFPRVT